MKIGILGAGQLAQLLAHSAFALGMETLCFTDSSDVPAARCSELYIGKLDDFSALEAFAKRCDVVTLENENIDITTLMFLQEFVTIYPGIEAIRIAQDRLLEKTLFQTLNIPTVPFYDINSLAQLQQAIEHTTLPVILKTRRFGYDGKGQVLIKERQQIPEAWESLKHVPAILEDYICFDYEVSIIAARNAAGEEIYYPLSKNFHSDGILRFAESPFEHPYLQQKAVEYSSRILKHLDYIGVLAFEFFVKDNELIANEIAPRVHNSGHATIEGYTISQFESHLRGISNLPLAAPSLRAPTLMCNIIGDFPNFTREDYKAMYVYNYGKEPRAGRKLGHITFIEPDHRLLEKWLHS